MTIYNQNHNENTNKQTPPVADYKEQQLKYLSIKHDRYSELNDDANEYLNKNLNETLMKNNSLSPSILPRYQQHRLGIPSNTNLMQHNQQVLSPYSLGYISNTTTSTTTNNTIINGQLYNKLPSSSNLPTNLNISSTSTSTTISNNDNNTEILADLNGKSTLFSQWESYSNNKISNGISSNNVSNVIGSILHNNNNNNNNTHNNNNNNNNEFLLNSPDNLKDVFQTMLMGSPLMIKTPAKKTPLRFQTTGSNAINYNGSNNIFNVNDSSVTKNILGTTPLRNLDLNVLFNLGNSNNKKITPCRRYLNLTPFNKNLLNNNNSNSAKSTNNASNNSNNIIMKFMTTNNNSKPQGECTPLFDVEKSGGVIIRTENTPTLLIDDDSSQNLNADILGNSTVNKVLQQQSHKIIERTKMVNEDANNNDNLKLSLHLNDSINNTNETQKRMNNIILNENAHIPSLQISEATAVENDDLNSSPTTIQLEESAVKKQPADLIPASPSSVFLLRELTLSPTPRTKVKRNKKRNNNGGEEDDVSLLTKKMGIDEGIPPAQIMIPPLQKAHTVTGAGLMELHSSNQSNTEDEGVDEGDVELKWKEDVKALRLGNNANKVLDVVPELPKMGSFNISKSVVTPINKNTFTNASKKRKRSISNNSTNSSVFTSFSNKKKKNKKKNCNFSSNKKNNKGATNNRFHIIVTDPNMFGPALPAPTKKSRRRTLSLKRSKSETFGDSNKKGKEE